MSAEAIPLAARRRANAVATDYWLLVVALALIAFGTIMVASASMTIAEREGGATFHYLFRHLVALGIAVASGLLLLRVSLETWQRAAPFLYLSGLVLLAMVLLPGVGRTANGATRWISVGGFNLQSSELMKLFMVVYVAAYMVRHREQVVGTLWGFVKPMLLLAVVSVLIVKQPDFGTTAVLVATTMAMLFLGGVALWPFAVLLGGALTALISLVVISPYRMQRVTAFLDPWADPFDSGFQLTQALIAFGRGEWTGVGLGNGIQKQFYLPEAHTDFLLAVVGEEFGLVGTLSIVALFAVFTWRALRIGEAAERAGQPFGAYLAYGIALWIGMQAVVNVGVNVGLLPTKGITLPFMSYGSNSLIVACWAVALLLRIDHEVRQAEPPKALRENGWASG